MQKRMKINEHAYMDIYTIDDSKDFQTGQLRPMMLVVPGGAYLVSSDREAQPIAFQFLANGYHAAILRYTTADKGDCTWPKPLVEAGMAMKMLHEHACEWFIDEDKIGVCGFSAGGNLAANLSVHWKDAELCSQLKVDSSILRPWVAILAYAVLDYAIMKDKVIESEKWKVLTKVSERAIFGKENPSDEEIELPSPIHYVTANTPPTFLWHTTKDDLVSVENTMQYALKLQAQGVPYEMHVFQEGEHGLALANEQTKSRASQIDEHVSEWLNLCLQWMKYHR